MHRSRYDEVIDGLAGPLPSTALGHGMDDAVTMGPLHCPQQKAFVAQLFGEARAAGAEVRELGAPADGADLSRGNFLRPSLVLDPSDDLRVVTEEQFGPTLPILPFDDEDNAVTRANDTWAGLTSSVWTADLDHAAALAARLVWTSGSAAGECPLWNSKS